LISAVSKDVLSKFSIGQISAKFNNAVADLILHLSLHFRECEKLNRVALSVGYFQNVVLLKASLRRLRKNNFEVFRHRKLRQTAADLRSDKP
jgi:hydrogenase maturation factor HypF (carbamoyltransferase family)